MDYSGASPKVVHLRNQRLGAKLDSVFSAKILAMIVSRRGYATHFIIGFLRFFAQFQKIEIDHLLGVAA